MKVEDRLLKIGQMWKDKKELVANSYIVEAEKSAYPITKPYPFKSKD